MKSLLLSTAAAVTLLVVIAFLLPREKPNPMESIAQAQSRSMEKCRIESHAVEPGQRAEFIAACQAKATTR